MNPVKKDHRVATGVLTGVTLLTGGSNSAVGAELQLEPQDFLLEASDSSEKSTTGSFLLDDTASTDLPFDQFDPSIGELAGVSIAFMPDEETFVSAFADGSFTGSISASDGGATFMVTNDSTFSVGLPDNSVESGLTGSANASCSQLVFGSDCPADDTVPLDPTFTIPISSGLGDYIGLGTVTISPLLGLAGVLDISLQDATPSTLSGTGEASSAWSGVATVTYEFTPSAAVPEPGSLLLIASGLAGLGFARRSRDSS